MTLQISLGTSCPTTAKAVGAVATAVSCQVFPLIIQGRLDKRTGQAIVKANARKERARREAEGPSMHFFFGREYFEKNSPEGLPAYDDFERKRAQPNEWVDPSPAVGAPDYFRFWQAYFEKTPPKGPIHWPEGVRPPRKDERAKASASINFSPVIKITTPVPVQAPAVSNEVAVKKETDTDASNPDAPATDAPKRHSIADIVKRAVEADLKRGRVSEDTAHDFERSVGLFQEFSGLEYVEQITQGHLSEFIEAHALIPRTYRRTEAERGMTIREIIESAEADGRELGLSAGTTNKSISAIQKLLRYAKAIGARLEPLDPQLLWVKDTVHAKDKREPFTIEEIRTIFKHPFLKEDAKRDALWWITHIAAYSGARREEIAGLHCEDIVERDGVPVMLIRPNESRRLKTGGSSRVVPLHADLILLGLVDYAKGRDEGMLFDIRRKSARANLGDSIHYRWRKCLATIADTSGLKTFHSLRHSAVQALINEGVSIEVRGALFGHTVGHIEGDLYGGKMSPAILRDAVNKLPSVRAIPD